MHDPPERCAVCWSELRDGRQHSDLECHEAIQAGLISLGRNLGLDLHFIEHRELWPRDERRN